MTGPLPESLLARLDTDLADDDAGRAARYPGRPATERQPVHTVYLRADRFDVDSLRTWGTTALAALDEHGLPDDALGDGDPAVALDRIRDKLHREPVEDLRIDLEDGYGPHPPEQEDADARRAGATLGALASADDAPAFCGLRIRSLEAPTRRRGLRTLELFLTELLDAAPLPSGFRITVPKVSSQAQLAAFNEVCGQLEGFFGLAPDSLRYEIQVELPQAVLGADGTATVAGLLTTAGRRCAGLHFGTYDYSAALGIAAAHQAMDAPSADFAKHVMQAAAAGTGVPVSDGSTNVLPVGSTEQVRAAWALHARLVRRSLERGLYQGWDLHPAQLVTRYAATFAFFRASFRPSVERLRDYVERRETGIADEPATAFALAGYLLRGLQCGAVDVAEIEAAGLDPDELPQLAGPRG